MMATVEDFGMMRKPITKKMGLKRLTLKSLNNLKKCLPFLDYGV